LEFYEGKAFVVLAMDVADSVGGGTGVYDSWGARPYDDLTNCLKYISEMPGIDMDHAVAAGGSYGGYMMNWIQGHELGRRVSGIP
jgi:dipeptidyl aminopeptidase/acylaminoacyl peptidase